MEKEILVCNQGKELLEMERLHVAPWWITELQAQA